VTQSFESNATTVPSMKTRPFYPHDFQSIVQNEVFIQSSSVVSVWDVSVGWAVSEIWSENYFITWKLRNRGRVVGTATGFGLDAGGVGVRVPVGSRIMYFPSRPALESTQTRI
jgi:hypothetical protein